jgi:hypothetical protein
MESTNKFPLITSMHKCAKPLSLMLLASILVSCATEWKWRAEKPDISNYQTIVVNKDYDTTWRRLIQGLAQYNIPLKSIEKDSGLITSEDMFDVDSSWFATVHMDWSNVHRVRPMKYRGTLRLTLQEIGSNSTQVNVNFFGEFESIADYDMFKNHYILRKPAHSNGRLEQVVAAYLNQ